MTECEALSERMPLVAHGESAWTAAEAGHLAQCAECAAEWRLVQVAAGLGRREAAAVDPALVAAGVHGRRVAARRWERRFRAWGAIGALAAAAAVALVVWPGPRPDSGPVRAAVADAPPTLVPELDSLSADELQSVLGSLDRPLAESRTLGTDGLGDLSDDQLATVLNTMEG